MKKILASLFIASAFLFIAPTVKAVVLESDLRSKTCQILSSTLVAGNTTTSYVLIDLNNTSVWPHKDTRQVNITGIDVQFDKLAASTASIQLGVVNFVNSSTGSVSYFYVLSSTINVSNTNIEQYAFHDNQFRNLRVNPGTKTAQSLEIDGVTPYLLTNVITIGSTAFQNDIFLPAPSSTANVLPGVGDIIVTINNQDFTNAIRAIITILYHTQND